MTLVDDIEAELAALRAANRLRPREDQLIRHDTDDWVDVSSNDYLHLARERVSRETLDALAGLPAGAGASRLIHGSHPEHLALESEVAAWVGQEAALLFSSGYAANVGLVSALVGPDDLVVSDALNHASTIDGCRLGRARIEVVPHRDVKAADEALRRPARRRWLLTESYFSMEGDSPDLGRLREVCDAHDAALLVDEAHALGVFGPRGSGLCSEHGVQADAVVGTLGKAVGLQGAFVAAPRPLIDWLWNRARSFVFSTAPSPLIARLARLHVKTVQRAENERERLQALSVRLHRALEDRGLPPPPDRHGPIFPVVVGTDERARTAAVALREAGFLTQAIRPPTVPEGSARLRIALHANLRDGDIDRLAGTVEKACRAS